ncbi:MAG: serine hydrolase [Aureispira sp.]|nr:serine hydrolase [Aureispira sp.]
MSFLVRCFVLGIFSIFGLFFSSFAQGNLVTQVDFLFSEFSASPNSPGASVLITKKGKTLLDKSYGLSNVKAKQAVSNKSNFRLASVTKQFTAFSIIQLIEKGKLKYTTPLTEIFPDFPSYGKKITILHLLQHTSGLKAYEKIAPRSKKDQFLDKDILELMKKQTTTYFEPGTRYWYSNSGYAVLAMVIEKISGLSYPQYVEKHIFTPLKMVNSIARIEGSKVYKRAYGYSKTIKSGFVQTDQSRMSAILGDGGIYTSAQEYTKWDQALYQRQLISSGMHWKIFQPWDGKKMQHPKYSYGLGWDISYDGDTKMVWHRGASIGFTNIVVRIPSEELSVLILCNRNSWLNVWQIGFALAALYSDYVVHAPIDPILFSTYRKSGLDKAIGLYHSYKKSKTDIYRFNDESLFRLGHKFIKINELDNALRIFQLNLKEYPKSWVAQRGMGNLYYKQKLYSKASSYYKKALEYAPKDPTEEEKEICKKMRWRIKK